ncbi:MAG: cytochrome c3 family protein [Deltaproteobacteria bacterium]|nr:cytochrome c3 family protein [Deltaproteobacteria bacterium]
MSKVKNSISLFCLIFFVVFLLSMIVAPVTDAKGMDVGFKKCVECHPGIKQEMAQKGKHEPFKKYQCSSCHNPHTSNYEHLIKDEISALCKSCHKGKKGSFDKKYSHPPFEEGACLKCHNPHSSKNPGLLKAKGEQVCFGCHAGKEMFSKKNKHDPVRKGNCLSCHSHHTSDYEELLKKSPEQLCVKCHSINNKKAKKAHLNYPVQGTNCISCHNPHGSNRGKLIKENSHKPFSDRKCTQCHNSAGSADPLSTKSKGISICITCHPAVKEDFRKINTHVGEGVFCTNCHNPHASDEAYLKKAKEKKICTDCHQDTKERLKDKNNKHKHPLVMEGKCTECHRPHGSNFELLYRTDEISACVTCHKRHATFTHPVGKGTIDPRTKGEISCGTCHSLMGSPYGFALRFDRKKQLCVQCHKGY